MYVPLPLNESYILIDQTCLKKTSLIGPYRNWTIQLSRVFLELPLLFLVGESV